MDPCHHGMAHSQVAEGNREYIEYTFTDNRQRVVVQLGLREGFATPRR